jgi:hypothetical protein
MSSTSMDAAMRAIRTQVWPHGPSARATRPTRSMYEPSTCVRVCRARAIGRLSVYARRGAWDIDDAIHARNGRRKACYCLPAAVRGGWS